MQNNNIMNTIKKGFRVLIALVIIVGAIYWGYTSTRSKAYSGSELSFKLAGGDTVIKNPTDEPIDARLTARGAFTIASDALDSSTRSTREGTGASAVNSVELELPPGSTDLRVTRGSDVTLNVEGETSLEATVSPVSTNGARTIWIVVAIATVGALYFISRTFEHRWIGRLRRRLARQNPGSPEQAST